MDFICMQKKMVCSRWNTC